MGRNQQLPQWSRLSDGFWATAALILGAFLFCAGLVKPALGADLVILDAGQRYEIDFESTVAGVNEGRFTGAGVADDPLAGQLDQTAWSFNGFSSSSDLSRGLSTGGVSTGGLYAFSEDPTGLGDRWLGVQATGTDFTPGEISLTVLNQTGQTVTDWELGYDLKIFNNENRSTLLSFAYSIGDGPLNYLNSLDYETSQARDTDASWETQSQGAAITAAVESGEVLRLHWFSDDFGGSGSRDEFGYDNIHVTASAAAVPEPGTCGLLFTGCLGWLARWQFRRRKRAKKTLLNEAICRRETSAVLT